jgi:hypothetical protein
MPDLCGKAKELYVEAHGQLTYDSYCDPDGTFHRGRPTTGRINSTPHFLHRPDHDVESIFWTLFSSLIRVYPRDSAHETDTHHCFNKAIKCLDTDVIDHDTGDSRVEFTGWEEDEFQSALHPKLATLGTMLHRIYSQVEPEYAYLSPPPRPDHLHEAMGRLLLQQIVDIGDDTIPLDPSKSRVPTAKGIQVYPSRLCSQHTYGTGEMLALGPPHWRK